MQKILDLCQDLWEELLVGEITWHVSGCFKVDNYDNRKAKLLSIVLSILSNNS